MGSTSSSRHPFLSLLTLLVWLVVGMAVFTVLGLGVCVLIYGLSIFTELSGQGTSNINSLKIIQFFSATGTFIFPAVMFARQESDPLSYLKLNSPFKLNLLIAAVVIFFVFTPFFEWTIVWNEGMKLPPFLNDLEVWMRNKEDELAVMTKQLLVMKSPIDLIVNLVVIAILAGVSEELFFRGCLQQLLIGWTKNYHLGIWIAAIIFSVIHVQFYGFIPRMLLGALFGYLFYFSKNLLIPMLAHTINNGMAVIGAYQLQLSGQSLDKLDNQMTFPAYAAYLSLIMGVFLLIVYRKLSVRSEALDEHRLG